MDWLRWVDCGNRMLENDLRATASDKLDCEAVERSDLALKLDPVHKKHHHINPAIPEMTEENILEG